MTNFRYITENIATWTKYKSIENAYQSGDLSVVLYDEKAYCIEKCTSDRIAKLVVKELRRVNPDYIRII